MRLSIANRRKKTLIASCAIISIVIASTIIQRGLSEMQVAKTKSYLKSVEACVAKRKPSAHLYMPAVSERPTEITTEQARSLFRALKCDGEFDLAGKGDKFLLYDNWETPYKFVARKCAGDILEVAAYSAGSDRVFGTADDINGN